MVLVPSSWWIAQYWDGEELAMPLSERYFKSKDAGNGWVLDVLNKDQPPELAPFCKHGRDASAKKHARKQRRPLDDEEEEDAVMSNSRDAVAEQAADDNDDDDERRDSKNAQSAGGDDDDDDDGPDEQSKEDDDSGDDDFPTAITSPFPIKFNGTFEVKKTADRLLPVSIIADGGLLVKSPYISGENHLCWARALEGVVAGEKGDLLAVAEDMSTVLLNVTADEAKILKKAQTQLSLKQQGLLSVRALHSAGEAMNTQLRWCRNNESFNWTGYPRGIPHLLVYCWMRAICLVVVQAKSPRLSGGEAIVGGYYATMYGCSCERVLTLEQLVLFFKNKRPQDRCVLLEGQSGSVSQTEQPSHFSHHLSLRPKPQKGAKQTADELARELRFWAQRRSAGTGEFNSPSVLRHVRRVATEIMKKRKFVLAEGDLERFRAFLHQDDADLMEQIRGTERIYIWDLY